MLRQVQDELVLATRGRGLWEFTDRVQAFVRQAGLRLGQVTLHITHTSASLLIQENADPTVRADLETIFARLAPDGDPAYRHNAEGEDDMAAHVRCALTHVNLTVPITAGRLALGTWQGIYLWEHRTRPHTRRVVVHAIGE